MSRFNQALLFGLFCQASVKHPVKAKLKDPNLSSICQASIVMPALMIYSDIVICLDRPVSLG